jgi:hypothetical protein
MSKITLTKTSFTSGEIDPALYGRVDLRAYDEGAATLENVLVQRTGGVTRRPGTLHLADVPNGRRLFPYDHGDIHDLLVFGDYAVHVVTGTNLRQTIGDVPWSIDEVAQIDVTLVGEDVLVCHPSYQPRLLRRGGNTAWSSSICTYDRLSVEDDDTRRAMPFARYAPPDVSLQVSRLAQGDDPTLAGSRLVDVKLVSSKPLFDLGYVGPIVFRIKGRHVQLNTVALDGEGRLAYGVTLEPLVDELATFDWDEQAFSYTHGWPIVAAMHQNRLVFGGSRDHSDFIWFSKSGRPFDFDMAEGEDDAAIAFRIVAERRHAIRQLFSGRVLQVFTTAGEWTIGGFPLTPRTARVELQTRVGSLSERQVAPVDVDGATLFVGATGRDLREFLFTETEQAYQAADIAVLSRHLMREPVDMAFDQQRRVFWIARADGQACAVTIDRNSNIVAWSLQRTEGAIRALAIHNGALVMLVERPAGMAVERLDDEALLDAQRSLTAAEPTSLWSGLDALDGGTYLVVADGSTVGPQPVANGTVELSAPASRIDLGLGFEHTVVGLPISSVSGRGMAPDAPYRPVRISLRIGPSVGVMLDTGGGPRALRLGGAAPMNDIFDVGVRAMGWRRGTQMPPWQLTQAEPGHFKLLSVTVEAKVNG